MNQPQFTVAFDQGTLLLPGHDRDEVESIFGSNIWTWDPRVAAWRCEAFHYRRVIMTLWNLREQKIRYQDQAKKWTDVEWAEHNIYSPRPEQNAAIESWMADKRGVVVMPTGTGKTEVDKTQLPSNAISR